MLDLDWTSHPSLALFPGLQCGLAIGCMGVRIETERTLPDASFANPKVRFLVLADASPSAKSLSLSLSRLTDMAIRCLFLATTV